MRRPRNVSAAELIKALSRYGYAVDRQKGSHVRLTTSSKGTHHLTIPQHDPLKIGTLSSILTDVAQHFGITKEELMTELFK